MSCQFTQTGSAGNPTGSLSASIQQAIQYANAVSQALGVDQVYVGAGSLASTTATFHFQTSTLKDPFGNTLAMLRIRE
jgi:hypothetical protein